ncbi:hypothetical protein EUBVEN_01679 [Eubacterium ventriosum ATCC 27560]|uniref:Uncharacterized protein n=1 Tax=Eubacterium ventriosum ATCC 27560 TaxID=411463 RepID=A5Z7J3_9FIRM|nr:hypothetical protein EUBVEN_01679 [Eubacterium ventriosum ATCC 27560]
MLDGKIYRSLPIFSANSCSGSSYKIEAAPYNLLSFVITYIECSLGVSIITSLNSSCISSPNSLSPNIISLMTSFMFLIDTGNNSFVFLFAALYKSFSVRPSFAAKSLLTRFVYVPNESFPRFHLYTIARSSNFLCGTVFNNSLFCSAFINVKNTLSLSLDVSKKSALISLLNDSIPFSIVSAAILTTSS